MSGRMRVNRIKVKGAACQAERLTTTRMGKTERAIGRNKEAG